MIRHVHIAVSAALLSLAQSTASAQCPDGTPAPLGSRRVETAPRPMAPPAASARARRILLLPFRNVTRAPAQEWLVSGAPIMLAAALGQFRDLTIVPEERLAASMRRSSVRADGSLDATQLRRIANETGGGGWSEVRDRRVREGRWPGVQPDHTFARSSSSSIQRPSPMELREQLQQTLGAAHRLERELGGSGMARVFIAADTVLSRPGVVQVLPPEIASGIGADHLQRGRAGI